MRRRNVYIYIYIRINEREKVGKFALIGTRYVPNPINTIYATRPLSLSSRKNSRERERENTRNFDVNNNNNKRSNSLDEWKIYRARRNRGIFNRVGSLETNVQSSVRDSRSVSSAAALDALHFQMQIHERCDGHERGQVYSSDMIYSSRVDVW